jgi:mono/diheme cytochrome c family protein
MNGLPFTIIASVAIFIVSFHGLRVRGEEVPRDAFRDHVRPVLRKYCIDCHNADDSAAGIAFDRFNDAAAALAESDVWFRALDALETRIMPPDDARRPGADEIARVVEWIEGDYFLARQHGRGGPVKAVLRRLNREEYNNTIRDLVGVDFHPADDFPQDEMGFGYDNIGAALTVSPSHVEKYLDAAERVLETAMVLPDAAPYPPAELIGLQPPELSTSGPVELEHEFAQGRYLADVIVIRRLPAESKAPRLVIGFGKDRRTVTVAVEQEESLTYRVWLQPEIGKNDVFVGIAEGRAVQEQPAQPATGDAKETGAGRARGSRPEFTVDSIVIRGPHRFEEDRLPAAHRRILTATPATNDESRMQCARQIVLQFAGRAFRRPIREDELERLLYVFLLAHERGESFERAIQVTLATVLVSPQFLYLVEPEPTTADRPLTEYELATRLSYFLWSSLPDDELFRVAREGSLRKDLRGQVARMLDDPKSGALVRNFVGQWLQLRKLAGVAPDRELFPEFDDALRQAVREETEQFFHDVLRRNGSVLEFLDAGHTFVNERLARHYGIEGVAGADFRRVALSGAQRGGLLTQASVLTVTSNPNRTSPVKRGQWILEQLLATPPPPPPPDVAKLDEGRDATQAETLRERLETHRSKPACAACHQRMDPLGFALENYDAIGRWRTHDGEFRVDPSGKLTDGRRFADAKELEQLLKAEPKRFCGALIRNLFLYALGRGLGPQDRVTIEAIRRQLVSDDYRFRTIITGIVESVEFQHRGVAK